jgi:putative heme-binding domain-containing protein
MGHLPRRSWTAPASAGLMAAILAVTTSSSRAEGPASPTGAARVPWTSSHLRGTPDAPLPYAAEVAFPRLAFDRPVLLAQVPGSRRLVVAEVGGKVVTFADDPAADRADVALDLAVGRPPLGGLYGLAFHPRFEENHQVFLCYALRGKQPEGTRVSRFTADRADPLRIVPGSEEIILTWLAGGHNGGCLAFGPDGYLYISTGDAESPSPPDPLDTGQDLGDLLSSILRIDVDRRDPGRAYRVPPDNPFVRLPGARPEIWAYGFRNPWRMSFDRATGDLWAGDVGWELWELIFRVERGGNYGWSVMEGRQPARPESRRGPSPILPPTADHPHSEAASITGGYVYRGTRLRDLIGTYIYGDYQSGKVWGLRYDGGKVTWRGELADTGLRLVSFGEDGAGELYLVEHERTNQVYRLVPNRASGEHRDFPRTLGRTGLFASTKDLSPAPGVVRYAINAEAWDDGARADRLLAIPGTGRIEVDPKGRWRLPDGSVLARTVSLVVQEGEAWRPRRLETQVLHREAGSWRPYTYIWDDDQDDATLAEAGGSSRTFVVRDEGAPGGRRELSYRFAARSECLLCHNPWVEARTTVFGAQSASPLAFDASQLSRGGPCAPDGEDQVHYLDRLGYFSRTPAAGGLPRLTDPYDERADLDARARAYLQVNCAHCHQYNAGGAATIALESSMPLEKTRTVDARPTQGAFGIDDARIIAPGEPERSVLYYRIAKTGSGRMPRVGSRRVDERATRLIGDWIARLPRPPAEGIAGPANDPVSAAVAALAATPAPSPSARDEAVRLLCGSSRGALALLRLIDRGKVDPPTLREVVARTKVHPRAEVRDLFERFVPDAERVERLGDAIDPEAILKLSGDAGRGRRWFVDVSAARCQACHRVGGEGADVGPALDAIGSKYARGDLLRHILEPSREVDPKFATHAVATADGRVVQGVLAEKTGRELVLRDAQGQAIRIPRADVVQEAMQPVSLMPEGLLRDLSAQQAADLLEYLASLKGR